MEANESSRVDVSVSNGVHKNASPQEPDITLSAAAWAAKMTAQTAVYGSYFVATVLLILNYEARVNHIDFIPPDWVMVLIFAPFGSHAILLWKGLTETTAKAIKTVIPPK